MATDVDLTVEDGIAWLTLRRPETIRPMLTTADVAEGVAAFLERRRPNFQGA